MFRAPRFLSKLGSRASSRGSMTLTSARFPPTKFVPRCRTALFSSKSPPPPSPSQEPIGRKDVEKNARETLKSDPSAVSTQSSVRHLTEESQAPKGDHDITAELKHDVGVVKDTFQFRDVPRESHILGLAGTLPYFGTSLSTLFLSWDLNKKWPTGNSFYDAIFVDHETARHMLSIIEPIQLGYGAVIISFLGAIHWGLEYAEKQPHRERTRFRYGVGLAAPIIAWPTLYLPVEYALTTQFMAFVALYFVDSRASTRGWAPYWYGAYRFLLTAMVGLAISISLVGRAKIGQSHTLSYQVLEERMSSPGIADNETDWAKLEKEEKERIRKEKIKAEKKAKKEEGEKKQKEREAQASGKQLNDDDSKKKEEDGSSEAKEEGSEKPNDDETESGDKSDKEEGSEKSNYEDSESEDKSGKEEEESTKSDRKNKDADDKDASGQN